VIKPGAEQLLPSIVLASSITPKPRLNRNRINFSQFHTVYGGRDFLVRLAEGWDSHFYS